MARKPKNATIDIRQAERGSMNMLLVIGCSMITISSLCKWYKK